MLLLVLFLAASSGVQAEPSAYQIRVDGLACPFCAYGIEKALLGLEGVEQVKTDIDAGIVTVTMSGSTTLTREQARTAVEEKAGFTLRDFDPVASADGQ